MGAKKGVHPPEFRCHWCRGEGYHWERKWKIFPIPVKCEDCGGSGRVLCQRPPETPNVSPPPPPKQAEPLASVPSVLLESTPVVSERSLFIAAAIAGFAAADFDSNNTAEKLAGWAVQLADAAIREANANRIGHDPQKPMQTKGTP